MEEKETSHIRALQGSKVSKPVAALAGLGLQTVSYFAPAALIWMFSALSATPAVGSFIPLDAGTVTCVAALAAMADARSAACSDVAVPGVSPGGRSHAPLVVAKPGAVACSASRIKNPRKEGAFRRRRAPPPTSKGLVLSLIGGALRRVVFSCSRLPPVLGP